MDVLRFAGEVADFRRGQLHLRGELVGRDAGAELVVPRVGFGVLEIRGAEEFAGGFVFGGGDAGGAVEVTQSLLGGHAHALVAGGEEAVAPVGLAVRRFAADILDRHVGREVLVERAEGVADPGAAARIAFAGEAGVHRDAARAVGVAARCHRVDERDVVHVLCHVRQVRADHLAALAGRLEGPGGLHQIAVLALEGDLDRTGQGSAVVFLEERLMIPEVDVRSRARAEDLEHLLGLRGEVGARRHGGSEVAHEEARQSQPRHASGHLAEEAAAGQLEGVAHGVRLFYPSFDRLLRPMFHRAALSSHGCPWLTPWRDAKAYAGSEGRLRWEGSSSTPATAASVGPRPRGGRRLPPSLRRGRPKGHRGRNVRRWRR